MSKVFLKRALSREILTAVTMAGVLASASLYSFNAMAAEEEDGPRAPPPTRSSDVLTERVFNQVSEIQELMSPEEEGAEPAAQGT